MNIINIGTPLVTSPAFRVTETTFFSEYTLLDAEMIFWDVASSYNAFPGYPKTKHSNVDEKTLVHIKNLLQNRKNELDEFFHIGRTLIITSPYFYRYEYEIQNTKKKFILDFIDCLEIEKIEYEKISGHNIQPFKEEYIEDFHRYSSDHFFYDIKITKPKGNPLLYIKDTKYVVSEYFKVKNGFIVILPRIRSNINSAKLSQNFCNSIYNLVNALKKANAPKLNEIPGWVDQYVLPQEKEVVINLSGLTEQLNQVKNSIVENEEKLLEFKFLKALFASDGESLEKAVEYVFRDLGFEINKPENNRDDLIIKLDNNIAVLEIKGLTKSAAEKNAAQLQKWVSNYHAENDYNPKGILVINTYKNEKLEDRTKVDFPEQMMKYVNQMNICLITGIQLLCIYMDFKTKKLTKEIITELFFNTVGTLNYKKNPMEIMEIV